MGWRFTCREPLFHCHTFCTHQLKCWIQDDRKLLPFLKVPLSVCSRISLLRRVLSSPTYHTQSWSPASGFCIHPSSFLKPIYHHVIHLLCCPSHPHRFFSLLLLIIYGFSQTNQRMRVQVKHSQTHSTFPLLPPNFSHLVKARIFPVTHQLTTGFIGFPFSSFLQAVGIL